MNFDLETMLKNVAYFVYIAVRVEVQCEQGVGCLVTPFELF